MNLKWVKCNDGQSWCTLAKVSLDKVATTGVYVIWKPGNPGQVVHLGQGNIAARLSSHRGNPVIMKHGDDLRVTWAAVPAADLDGVERYLYDKYQPIEGQRAPDVPPTPVNLPGE
jgi:hypothetical protein